MSALNLSPLIAELAFEKMLPSGAVLIIVDQGPEYWLAIVGIHLKVLVECLEGG